MKTLSLVIKNREKTLFQGEVNSISSENKKGVFDVLPRHANFISLIKNKIIVRDGKEEKTVPLKNGLMRVWENEIFVYLDIESQTGI